MNKAIRRLTAVVFAVFLLLCNSFTAVAENLPDGKVEGLPDKITVLDSDGNSVSDRGEYFFQVEEMKPLVDYSKDIQLINLREDKAYHIYMYAQPVSNEGDIDLENNCTAVFSLDNKVIFKGKVTGKAENGFKDMDNEPVDLGLFEPNESHNLTVNVNWNGNFKDVEVDNGSKKYDSDGIHIIKDKSGNSDIMGNVKFRWIFYAVIDENYVPPKTGVFTQNSFMYIIICCVLVLAILILCILIYRKKHSKKA